MRTTIAVNRPHAISETIDGEAVIVNLETGWYYTLSGVGVAVWNAIQQPVDPDEVARVLARTYELPAEVVADDVNALVEILAHEQLVVKTDDEPSSSNGAFERFQLPDTYQVPVLEKFTDMEDLILLDPVHEVDERGWPHARDPDSLSP